MTTYIMGIDIGTTSVKVCLINSITREVIHKNIKVKSFLFLIIYKQSVFTDIGTTISLFAYFVSWLENIKTFYNIQNVIQKLDKRLQS